jgi:nicotinate-nucleotide--dimethylbenzimidazole phosphoribosyltransferase
MKVLNDTLNKIRGINLEEMKKREKTLDSLLKTPKGLGKLEDISIQIAGIDSSYKVNKKAVIVMAADNGVEREGVSAGARIITTVLAHTMLAGKASINSLAKSMGSDVFVVNLGIDTEDKFNGIVDKVVMKNGTNNIRVENAMTREEAVKAIESGIEVTDELIEKGYNLLAIGEIGIGNTTTSSAILKAVSKLSTEEIVGVGSGIDMNTLELKKRVVEEAVKVNLPYSNDPIEILYKLGGLDIAAMTGAYLSAAKNRVPVVIDGFISGVSAYLAYKICSESKEFMIPSHISEEPGAKWIMNELGFEPNMYMKMKLGEGSGAVLMFPMVEAALNMDKDIAVYPR